MRNIKHIFKFLAGLWVLAVSPLAAILLSQDSESGLIVNIELRDAATVNRPTIQIQDVAWVSGGSAQTIEQIRRLDLHELRLGEKVSLEPSHLKIRLLLAGFSRDKFKVVGSRPVIVKWLAETDSNGEMTLDRRQTSSPKTAETTDHPTLEQWQAGILQAIRQKAADAFSLQPDAVIVHLDNQLNGKQLQDVADSGITSPQFELLENGRQVLGARRLRVAIVQNNVRKQVINIFADTSIVARIPVATTAIAPGEVFSADNVAFQAEEIRNPSIELLTELRLLGKTSNRRIVVGSEIPFSSVQNLSTRSVAEQKQIIKSRDVVSVIARVGSVSVRLNNATALQAGNLGDVIRVRNEDSQKTITCRVVASNEVEAIVR